MSNYNHKKKSGFAETKEYPHRKHPSNYRKIDNDMVEYITFTHHDVVEINGKKYITIPLNDNIDKRVQNINKGKEKKDISYVYPKVYITKRSALGKDNKNYYFVPADKVLIDDLYNKLPREKVKYLSNSKKKK